MRGQKINAFVMMPFHKDFDPVYAGIESVCWSRGVFCYRADQGFFSEAILEHVQRWISKSDILIADMTRRNPNVFYEIGYAHAMNKSVVLLAGAKKDIPFDVQQYQAIIYGDNLRLLKGKLAKHLDDLANKLRPRKLIRLARDVDEYCEYHGLVQASFKRLRSRVSEPCRMSDFNDLIEVMWHYYAPLWIEGGWPGLVLRANKRYWSQV